MATIQNTIAMQDRMTPVFNKMIKAMQSTMSVMEQVNRASENALLDDLFREAHNDIIKANRSIEELKENMDDVNQSTSRTPTLFNRIGQAAFNVNQILSVTKTALDSISRTANFLDGITQSEARLNNVNDGLQTTAELQDMIYKSAQRTGSAYTTVADTVVSLMNNARDAFGSNAEVIAFAELLNKSFVNAGTSAESASSAMLQLTQALSSGVLQGDEFRSIAESAPAILNAVADYMGKSRAEVKALSSEGKITADVVKNAMFAASEDINTTFASMLTTFAQQTQKLKNVAQMAFRDVANTFSNIMNSEQMLTILNSVMSGIQVGAAFAQIAMEGLGGAISFVSNVLTVLSPLLGFMAIVLMAIGITHIPTLTMALWAKTKALWASSVAWLAQKLAIDASTTSVWGFISAMLAAAWPVGLIVLGIIALISILNYFGITTDQIVGFVIGLFYMLLASVYNVVTWMINPFLIFANFLSNLFIDPIGAVKMLFLDMAEFVVSKIAWVAKALEGLINLIPGVEVNMTNGLDNLLNNIQSAKSALSEATGVKEAKLLEEINLSSAFKNGYEDGVNLTNSISDAFSGLNSLGDMFSGANQIDYSQFGANLSSAFKNGYEDGVNLTNSISDAFSGLNSLGDMFSGANQIDYSQFGASVPDLSNGVGISGGSLDSVGRIEDDVTITDEDIKLLKDIASTDFINSYTTLQPNMTVTFGDVKETADTNRIIAAIEEMTQEALSNVIVEEEF